MPPDVGDIVWVELDPVKGTEQAGRRPALVLSSAIYHDASKRAVVCPITAAAHSWPFNVRLPHNLITKGAVLVDQIRTIDRSVRMFDTIERAPPAFLEEVRGKLATLLGFEAVLSIADPNEF
jgi:mRNA interferase MazF